jgi:hypothetical protein
VDFLRAVAFLTPVVVALGAPLLIDPPGWKRPTIFAAALLGLIATAALAAGAPAQSALKLGVLTLSLTILAAGAALCVRRPGASQLAVGLLFALLIGLVFLMGPAVAADQAHADWALPAALNLSPHAAVDAALGGDFLHEPFFYASQSPAPAEFHFSLPPWHRAPSLWAAAGLLLGAAGLGLRRGRRAAG